MMTYVHLCVHIEHNTLKIYWNEKCLKWKLYTEMKYILRPSHFFVSHMGFEIIKQIILSHISD
jgi:hypothetical protein